MMQLPLQTIGTAFVVYRIDVTGWCAYVGYCPLLTFSKLDDANRNIELVQLMNNPEFKQHNPTITVIDITTEEKDAFELWAVTTQRARPGHAFKSKIEPAAKPGRKGNPIRRIDDPANPLEFESAAEACQTYGIHPSNMSNHLNGLIPRVKGMRFEWL